MSQIQGDFFSRSISPNTTSQSDIPAIDSPIHSKDTLQTSQSSVTSQQGSVTSSTTSPQLEPPTKTNISLQEFLKAVSDATRGFRQQLSASATADQESRIRAGSTTGMTVDDLLRLQEERQKILDQIAIDTNKSLEKLNQLLDEMRELERQQKSRIDDLNSGNEIEQRQHDLLAEAYKTYLANLERMGVIDQGDGTYLIPEGKEQEFNQYTANYQKAVGDFNVYWQGRLEAINSYNSATLEYNKKVAEYNLAVDQFIEINKLSEYLNLKNLTIPKLTLAEMRDLSERHNQIQMPAIIGSSLVSIPPLPNYVNQIGSSGPSPIPPLPTTPAFDTSLIHGGIFATYYENRVTYIDKIIEAGTSYVLINWMSILNPSSQGIPDPILNFKPFSLLILPDALISPKPALKSTPSLNALTQAFGSDDNRVKVMMGSSLIAQALDETTLKSKLSTDKKEELANRLLLLSAGLIKNQALQGLFPAYSPIADVMANLPKDSPAFAILFAISLANRVQEDTNQGNTLKILEEYTKKIPELSNLTPQELEKIAAAVNLGQLLTSMKVLEENLGLPGLTSQILPSLSTSIKPTDVLPKAEQENEQEIKVLQNQLHNHFVQKGFPQPEAKFLADTGVQFIQQGLNTPTATTIPTPTSINQPMLQNSLTSSLILNHQYPLSKAQSYTAEVLEIILKETPYASAQQFRTRLESELKSLGIPKSTEIASQVVLTPSREPSFTLSEKKEPLSRTELMSIIENSTRQLLTPQIGTDLAKQVTQELNQTLFGSPTDKSSYSHVDTMKEQLQILNTDKDKKWSESVSKAFKETIKTMESFPAFALKIMNPAYSLILSPIFYKDYGKKRSDSIFC